MTVYGWDASDYDWSRGPMDLAAAKAAGVRFFTHKATEGTSVKHRHYGEALTRARAAGIEFLGAYIVPRTPGPSVAAQVDYFLSYVDQQTPWWREHPGWFWQVDTEKWSYDRVSPHIGEQACQLLRDRTGRWVVHYAPRWAYGDTIPGSTPLWASDYGTNAEVALRDGYPGDGSARWRAYSGRTPTFLQYGSRLRIGSQDGCDGNAFRGSLMDLRKLISGTEDPLMALSDQDQQALIWRTEALIRNRPTVEGGPLKGEPNDLHATLAALAAQMKTLTETVAKLAALPAGPTATTAAITGGTITFGTAEATE